MERGGRKSCNLIGRDPTDVKQECAVFGRERGDALQHAVVVVARVVLALDGKRGVTHMVEHTVNEDVGRASEHVDVKPVEEFLQVLGLVPSQALWIVQQESMERREMLGYARQLLRGQE